LRRGSFREPGGGLAASGEQSILENLYGPTEATIAITYYRWDSATSPEECVRGLVPIGWPFDGQQVCAVTEELAPVALGESGELCLGGSQVTGGYLNDPEKTAKASCGWRIPAIRFGIARGSGAARRSRLPFLSGRRDFQVKISGYRVELQEIDLVLRKRRRRNWRWRFRGHSRKARRPALWGRLGRRPGARRADYRRLRSPPAALYGSQPHLSFPADSA